MVRSRKKSSTDNDTEVVATPSRRSGRARKTVSYGEEDEIPQALRKYFNTKGINSIVKVIVPKVCDSYRCMFSNGSDFLLLRGVNVN